METFEAQLPAAGIGFTKKPTQGKALKTRRRDRESGKRKDAVGYSLPNSDDEYGDGVDSAAESEEEEFADENSPLIVQKGMNKNAAGEFNSITFNDSIHQ